MYWPRYYENWQHRPLPPFHITASEPVAERPAALPTAQECSRIIDLGKRPGWGPHRIDAHLRHHNTPLPLDTIRWVLQNQSEALAADRT